MALSRGRWGRISTSYLTEKLNHHIIGFHQPVSPLLTVDNPRKEPNHNQEDGLTNMESFWVKLTVFHAWLNCLEHLCATEDCPCQGVPLSCYLFLCSAWLNNESTLKLSFLNNSAKQSTFSLIHFLLDTITPFQYYTWVSYLWQRSFGFLSGAFKLGVDFTF